MVSSMLSGLLHLLGLAYLLNFQESHKNLSHNMFIPFFQSFLRVAISRSLSVRNCISAKERWMQRMEAETWPKASFCKAPNGPPDVSTLQNLLLPEDGYADEMSYGCMLKACSSSSEKAVTKLASRWHG